MGLYMTGHAVVLKADGIKLSQNGNLLMVKVEQGDCAVQISLSPEVADDLSRRLEFWLQDRQRQAHPETLDVLEASEG